MFDEVLSSNYFKLFELEQDFIIDSNHLQNKMRELQNIYHPDNFANNQDALNQALSVSSYINSAYQTLLNSQTRAIYLLGLNDIVVDLVHDTKFSIEFLMTQIELRERIEEAQNNEDIDELENIESELNKDKKNLEIKISELFLEKKLNEIIELVKQLAFYNKLLIVVDDSISSL